MISKGSALYIHAPKPTYDCDDCVFFIANSRRCVLHSVMDHIDPEGSCGYFVQGTPELLARSPFGLITKEESGYVDDVNEASCKRCASWLQDGWDCQTVDKNSKGDDQGMIHPDACCCLWQKDPERGNWPEEVFSANI